jgi:hypothetical protein
MKRRIALDIETSPDGERCDPGCMHHVPVHHGAYHRGEWCEIFGAMYDGERSPACIEAERKALAMGGE